MFIYPVENEDNFPMAGCDCYKCQMARMEGKQEWIEPEHEPELISKPIIFLDCQFFSSFHQEELPSFKRTAKALQLSRRDRANKWAKAAELKEKKAVQKVRLAILFVFLSIIVVYFGLGVYHGLKN